MAQTPQCGSRACLPTSPCPLSAQHTAPRAWLPPTPTGELSTLRLQDLCAVSVMCVTVFLPAAISTAQMRTLAQRGDMGLPLATSLSLQVLERAMPAPSGEEPKKPSAEALPW